VGVAKVVKQGGGTKAGPDQEIETKRGGNIEKKQNKPNWQEVGGEKRPGQGWIPLKQGNKRDNCESGLKNPGTRGGGGVEEKMGGEERRGKEGAEGAGVGFSSIQVFGE